MSRQKIERILVKNLIDFDSASELTPRHIVEWWADQTFNVCLKERGKGFTLFPLNSFVKVLKNTTAKIIKCDYLISEEKSNEEQLNEKLFLGYCREKFRNKVSIHITNPTQFVDNEINGCILDLTREIEYNNYE